MADVTVSWSVARVTSSAVERRNLDYTVQLDRDALNDVCYEVLCVLGR